MTEKLFLYLAMKFFRFRFEYFLSTICILFIIAMISVSWVGFLETDDLAYSRAAEGWISAPPFLGSSHWALRHFIVLPLAASFRVFGQSEASLAVPTLFYGFGLLVLTFLCVRQTAGSLAGTFASTFVASIPAFASGATTVYTDVPEAFFVTASLWAFSFAIGSQRQAMFVLAGLLAGCGFLTRETAIVLPVLYLILFLAGYGGRGNYLWMGTAFLAIVGIDTLYLWLMSGDPFWRTHITQRGIAGDSPYTPGLKAPAGGDDPLKLYSLPRSLQALTTVFASPAIGLLPWFGVPAAAYSLQPPISGDARKAASLFALLAILWFLLLSFVFMSLWLIPRYQIVTVSALALPSSLVLTGWLDRGHRMRVAAVLLPLLAGSLILAAAPEHQPMFGEQALAGFMRDESEMVLTDPATLRGSGWLLEITGAGNRVVAGLPSPGILYYVNHSPRRRLPDDWPIREIPTGATIIKSFVQQPGIVARTAAWFRLDRILPSTIWKKVAPPLHRAEMVRMPAG